MSELCASWPHSPADPPFAIPNAGADPCSGRAADSGNGGSTIRSCRSWPGHCECYPGMVCGCVSILASLTTPTPSESACTLLTKWDTKQNRNILAGSQSIHVGIDIIEASNVVHKWACCPTYCLVQHLSTMSCRLHLVREAVYCPHADALHPDGQKF